MSGSPLHRSGLVTTNYHQCGIASQPPMALTAALLPVLQVAAVASVVVAAAATATTFTEDTALAGLCDALFKNKTIACPEEWRAGNPCKSTAGGTSWHPDDKMKGTCADGHLMYVQLELTVRVAIPCLCNLLWTSVPGGDGEWDDLRCVRVGCLSFLSIGGNRRQRIVRWQPTAWRHHARQHRRIDWPYEP